MIACQLLSGVRASVSDRHIETTARRTRATVGHALTWISQRESASKGLQNEKPNPT
jgi:hypothetical protein